MQGGEEEEDEEFKGGSDGSESGSGSESDAELIAEEGISVEAVSGAPSTTCPAWPEVLPGVLCARTNLVLNSCFVGPRDPVSPRGT